MEHKNNVKQFDEYFKLKHNKQAILCKILRTKEFEKDLDLIPERIRIKAIFWINSVELLGLLKVRKRPGYHDEPLQGDRIGQRSVRLNRSYRLIYRESAKHIEILLLEINKHDY